MPVEVYSAGETLTFPYKDGMGRIQTRELTLSEEYLNRNVTTPDRMIFFGGLGGDTLNLTTSTLFSYEMHCVCLHFEYNMMNEVNPNVVQDFKAAGAVRISDVLVIVPTDSFIPTLANHMRENKPIQRISIKTLHWTGGDHANVLEEHVFGFNYIVHWVPGRFIHAFVFRPQEWFIQYAQFDQTTAMRTGTNADSFNFRTGIPTTAIQPDMMKWSDVSTVANTEGAGAHEIAEGGGAGAGGGLPGAGVGGLGGATGGAGGALGGATGGGGALGGLLNF